MVLKILIGTVWVLGTTHVINAAEPFCAEPPSPPSSGHEGCQLSSLNPSLWFALGQSHLTQVIPLPCVEACTQRLVTRDIKTQSSYLDLKPLQRSFQFHISQWDQLGLRCKCIAGQLLPVPNLLPSLPVNLLQENLKVMSSRQRILTHAIVPSHKKSFTTFLVHSSFWLKSCCCQLLIDNKTKTRVWFQS